MEQEQVNEVIKQLISAGFQVSPDAIEFLLTVTELSQIVERTLGKLREMSDPPMVITRQLLEDLVAPKLTAKVVEPKVKPPKAPKQPPRERATLLASVKFKPLAKEVSSDIKVVSNPDKNLQPGGSVEDFLNYFQDRFHRLQQILSHRPDVGRTDTIKEVLKREDQSEVKFVGMVFESRETKKGNLMLMLEDLEAEIRCIVPLSLVDLAEQAGHVQNDHVVCINGRLISQGGDPFVLVKEIIWPNVPLQRRKVKRIDENICAALISDIHFGSREFLDDYFQRFLIWLQGRVGSQNERTLAGRIKYVLIAGDLVEGVGVYPGQEKTLLYRDLKEQYKRIAELLLQVPDYIEMIAIPGNHDATPQAIPQPAFFTEFAEPLQEVNNLQLLGNPSQIQLHGIDITMCHGISLIDVISNLPGGDYNKTAIAMKEYLRCRNLFPTYGERPLAPQPRDWFVLDPIPDILHMGHTHVNGINQTPRTLLINSGTFQAQTDYMKLAGITPTPGIVPVVDLQTLKPHELTFT